MDLHDTDDVFCVVATSSNIAPSSAKVDRAQPTMTITTRRRRLFTSVLQLVVLTVSSLSTNPIMARKKPSYEAEIDYSAANEYVEAHYGNLAPRTPYFGQSVKKECIYDAREGVYDDNVGSLEPPTIDFCGFTLLEKPTTVADWSDLSQIRDIYLPELQSLLQETYRDSMIRDIIFWNPMLRGQDLKQTRPNDDTNTPTASFAASPHIDTDIGAFENPEHLIRLFEKNRVVANVFPTDRLVQGVKKGCRFAIVNAWRNIAETPVVRAPLALFSATYDEQRAFPEAAPNMDLSRWYIFSNVTKNEVLLFCQYDRDKKCPSDLWHCA